MGLVGLGSADPAVTTDSGPSLVVLGNKQVTVRLAGSAKPTDRVLIRQAGSNIAVPLDALTSCSQVAPTPFNLIKPTVQLLAPMTAQNPTSQVVVKVTNHNAIDAARTAMLGVPEIDYTAYLVDADTGKAVGGDEGTLLRFDRPGTQTFAMPASAVPGSGNFVARVITPSGHVAQSAAITLAHQARPSASHPGSVGAAQSQPPAGASPSAAAQRPTADNSGRSGPADVGPSSGVGGPTGNITVSTPTDAGSPSSAAAPAATPTTPTPRPAPDTVTVASVPLNFGSLFSLRGAAALIVLVLGLVISGMFGMSVLSSRRR